MINSHVISFLALAALLTITPGSDVVLVLRNSISRDSRAGLWTAAGICSGFFVQPLLAALGLAAIFVRSAAAFDAVKWAGSAYLIYLGAQSLRSAYTHWRGKGTIGSPINGDSLKEVCSPWISFREGLLTNALNPKIAVFYFAILPQFIDPGDPVLLKSLLLAGAHYVMGAIWLTFLAIMAGKAKRLLMRRTVRTTFDATSGAVLIGFGFKLATTRSS